MRCTPLPPACRFATSAGVNFAMEIDFMRWVNSRLQKRNLECLIYVSIWAYSNKFQTVQMSLYLLCKKFIEKIVLFISWFLWLNLLRSDEILMSPDFVYYRKRHRIDGRSTVASDTERYSRKNAGFNKLRSCFSYKLTHTKSVSWHQLKLLVYLWTAYSPSHI